MSDLKRLQMTVSLRPLQEIQVTLPRKGIADATAALPIPVSVCSIFMCPNDGVAASVWDF